MGKKYVAEKIFSGLVGVFSSVVMLFAIMFAMVRESMWPFLLVAALTCPLWHWALRKYVLKEQLLKLWIIRGSAVIIGCIFLVFANARFPFYSCRDIMIVDRMNTLYETEIKKDTTELIDVTGIQKSLQGDFYKIDATIHYKDTKTGEKMSVDRELYFDRYNGQYFASLENLKKYRVEKKKMAG